MIGYASAKVTTEMVGVVTFLKALGSGVNSIFVRDRWRADHNDTTLIRTTAVVDFSLSRTIVCCSTSAYSLQHVSPKGLWNIEIAILNGNLAWMRTT